VKLTVVIPNYNQGRYLAEAIDSVLSQDHLPDEILVLDDGSTDNSLEVIETYEKVHPFITSFRNAQNMGFSYTIQRLIKLASGPYVLGLAADDKILPGCLKNAMAMMREYPQAGLCSALSVLMDDGGCIRGPFLTPILCSEPKYFSPAEVRGQLVRQGCWFAYTTIVYRKDAMLEAGGFDRPELGPLVDAFAYHYIALKYGACFIPEYAGAWRRLMKGFSMSSAKDIDRYRSYFRSTVKLMQSDGFADLFPERYVTDWEKRQVYWMGEANLSHLKICQQFFLEDMGKILTRRWSARLFLKGCSLFFTIQHRLIQAFLLIKSYTYPTYPLMVKSVMQHYLRYWRSRTEF